MVAVRRFFDTGNHGDTVTAALAKSDTINFSGGTATLTNLYSYITPLAAKLTGTVAGHLWFAEEGMNATRFAADAYIYVTANPSATFYIMWSGNSSAQRSLGIRMTATRTLLVTDDTGTSLYTSSAIPLNTWVRLSFDLTCHTTAGAATFAWYLGHDVTPQQTWSSSSGLATRTHIDRMRWGTKAATTSGTGEIIWGSYALDETSTGLIPPWTPPAEPVPPSQTRGDLEIDELYVGDNAVSYGFVGDTVVWPPGHGALLTTVSGTSFAPKIALKTDPTSDISWSSLNATVGGTDLAPTFSWSTSGPHKVTLLMDKPEDLVTINFGFDHEDDEGVYNIGATYDWSPQPVTGVVGLTAFPELKHFLAANTTLTGPLDFTGLSSLEFIECFEANVTALTLTGCTSLIRICLESNQISYLDLNPVKDCLYDLRAANMQGGTLTFATLTGDGLLDNLYHFCVRTQQVINEPKLNQMPVIDQWWVWSSGITSSGTPISTTLSSPQAHNNALDQASVNGILNWINANVADAFGTIRLEGGTNAAPSGAAITAAATIDARANWTVTTN